MRHRLVSNPRLAFGLFCIWLLILAGLIVIAPEEKTLGTGIKVVYVHVAMIWTGMAGFLLTALFGIWVALRPSKGALQWTHAIARVSFLMFTGGALLSLVAARVNWGGVFLSEPRMLATTQLIALMLIVLVTTHWLKSIRLKGVLYTLPFVYMLTTVLGVELVLHPESPVVVSSAAPIQLTFFALFALFSLLALWLVWVLKSQSFSSDFAKN